MIFFFSSRRRHTRSTRDWSSDVCSSDLSYAAERGLPVYDDPANRDPRHLRSWVRTTLLPLLTERLGPRLRSDLLAHGRHAARERRAWDQVLELVPDLALGVERDGFAVARASVCGYDNELSVGLLRA